MRRIGEIMEDLGFREEAPEGVKKAFVKNLMRAAYGADVKNIGDYRTLNEGSQETPKECPSMAEGCVGEQLSFDLFQKNG